MRGIIEVALQNLIRLALPREMNPNLLEATRDYWHKLDDLEAAYNRGEVSLEYVDRRVQELMEELGAARREAFTAFFSGLSRWVTDNRETVLGGAFIGLLTYGWLVFAS